MENTSAPAQRSPGQQLGVPGSQRFYGPEELGEDSLPSLGLTNGWRKGSSYLQIGGFALLLLAHLFPVSDQCFEFYRLPVDTVG